jgi:hypothetical protein
MHGQSNKRNLSGNVEGGKYSYSASSCCQCLGTLLLQLLSNTISRTRLTSTIYIYIQVIKPMCILRRSSCFLMISISMTPACNWDMVPSNALLSPRCAPDS